MFCCIIDYTPVVPVGYDPLGSVIFPSPSLPLPPLQPFTSFSPPLFPFASRPILLSFSFLSLLPSLPSFCLVPCCASPRSARSQVTLTTRTPGRSCAPSSSSSSSAPLQLTSRRVDHDPEYSSFSAPSISPTVLNVRAGTLNPTPTATLVCRQSRLEAISL